MKKLLSLSTVALTVSIGLSGMAQAQSPSGTSARTAKARPAERLDDDMIEPAPLARARPAIPLGELAKPMPAKLTKSRHAQPFDDDLVEPLEQIKAAAIPAAAPVAVPASIPATIPAVPAALPAPASRLAAAPVKPTRLRSADPLGDLVKARSVEQENHLTDVPSGDAIGKLIEAPAADSMGDLADLPIGDPLADLARFR